MTVNYRKNSNWTAIYVNVNANELNTLDQIILKQIQDNMTPKEKKAKKWQTIDIVDTIVVASNSNPISQQLTLELLIYVADMTGQ